MKLWDGERVREDIVYYRIDKKSVMLYPNRICYPDKDGTELMIGIGVDDVNGNEIFTNHVVRWQETDGEHFGIVQYHIDCYPRAGFIIMCDDGYIRECFVGMEIVGNKWENSDLVFE